MDVNARNQYLRQLQQRYLMAKSRKEKSSILDEYCGNTHQNRKYVIGKINFFLSAKSKKTKKRKQIYDGYVKAAFAKVWKIFDYPFRTKTSSSIKERGL